MNKKVFITTFVLFGFMLVDCILAKTVFGADLAIVIENSKLIEAGEYLDAHFWIKQAAAFVCTFATYILYLCAVSGKWILDWKEFLIVTPTLIAMQFAKIYTPTVGMYLDMIAMIVLPFIVKSKFDNGSKYKVFILIYCIHCLGQLLCLYVRSLPIQMISINSAVSLVAMIDQYIVQIMYYLFGNFLGGRYGNLEPTIHGER